MEQRKTEIFIETREQVFVRRSTNELQAVCAEYQTESVFIAPEQSSIQAGMSVREIFRGVESGAIHFIETAEGLTLVCLASLENSIVNQQVVGRLDERHPTARGKEEP